MNEQRRPARNAAATIRSSSNGSAKDGRLAENDRLIDVRERLVHAIDELEAGDSFIDPCRALLEGLLEDFDGAYARARVNMDIRLCSLSFELVTFALLRGDDVRHVTVLVASGRDWLPATQFPHIRDETGESTGDRSLDRAIRVRASEELIRLEAAVSYLQGRVAA